MIDPPFLSVIFQLQAAAELAPFSWLCAALMLLAKAVGFKTIY